MPRRTQTPSGGDLQTMTRTKGGPDSTSRLNAAEEHKEWCACFRAALTGTTAAQRRAPNPEMIVRWSIGIADRAMAECRRRRP